MAKMNVSYGGSLYELQISARRIVNDGATSESMCEEETEALVAAIVADLELELDDNNYVLISRP